SQGSNGSAGVSLLGSSDERSTLLEPIDGVAVEGQVVIVHGQPGAGKWSIVLWAERYAADRGLMVLQVTGVQAEAKMPFAGLHQLLRPVLDRRQALPIAQHNALSAFGATDARPDVFLIELAALRTNRRSRRPTAGCERVDYGGAQLLGLQDPSR